MSIQKEIEEFGLSEEWEDQDVWSLPGEVCIFGVNLLEEHLNLPFLGYQNKEYCVCPKEVIKHPHQFPTEYARVLLADEKYPIDIVQHPVKGHWVILDGLHRLMKAVTFNKRAVKVRIIAWGEFKAIARTSL
jgi:hypothetical protein